MIRCQRWFTWRLVACLPPPLSDINLGDGAVRWYVWLWGNIVQILEIYVLCYAFNNYRTEVYTTSVQTNIQKYAKNCVTGRSTKVSLLEKNWCKYIITLSVFNCLVNPMWFLFQFTPEVLQMSSKSIWCDNIAILNPNCFCSHWYLIFSRGDIGIYNSLDAARGQ